MDGLLAFYQGTKDKNQIQKEGKVCYFLNNNLQWKVNKLQSQIQENTL